MHVRPRYLVAVCLAAIAAVVAGFTLAQGSPPAPTTKIEHLVVIFDENESFDHYFGTYPNATNPVGEPAFTAAAGTPIPDNYVSHPNLLTANPNTLSPVRLDRSVVVPCGQNHSYGPEQAAAHAGAMDKFVQNTGGACSPSIVMNYYDGNTVTALWNYANHFAMSDNFYGSTYGPSTPGAINLISGDTHGVNAAGDTDATGSITGDPNPLGDDCGNGGAQMSGPNIGSEMNTAGVTWGWFQGGFKPTSTVGITAHCDAAHANAAGANVTDYSAHHEPFQYYASTSNLHHLPPTSVGAIGTTDQANHQYDLTDFDAAVAANNLPQVSFIKPASFQDAHPGNSGPLDEQRFIVNTINELESSPAWATTAVVITYDDSDGWYDHKFAAPSNTSAEPSDQLNGSGACGDAVANPPLGGWGDRCGPGPRLPFIVVSPWAKQNYIDHTQLDQSSIMKFIEDNWGVVSTDPDSFDHTAGDMRGLFDFAPATGQAPKLTLDGTTGLGPGGIVTPPPPPPTTTTTTTAPPTTTTTTPPTTTTSVTPPPTTTTATTTTTTTKPIPKPTAKARLSFTSKKSGRTLKLSFKVTGLSASKGKITVTIKLTKGHTTIASGHGTVHAGRLTVTLKAKHTISRGTYTLTTTVTQAHKATRFTKTLKFT